MKDEEVANKKIEFLYAAIKDAQELIRFIDTKTAIVITILGAFIVSYFTILKDIIQYSYYFSFVFWIIFILFILSLLLCISIVLRIIRPTNNPIDNININKGDLPKLRFFLPLNKYKNKFIKNIRNSKNDKLNEYYSDIIKLIIGVDNNNKITTEDDIIKSLTFEFMKVSFIRNIKVDRFNSLIFFLAITFILFIISYIICSVQIQEILKHTCCK